MTAPETICPIIAVPEATNSDRSASAGQANSIAIDTRVLHVINGEHFSGAERVQAHLGRCLPEYGVSADFLCVKPGKFPEMLRDQARDQAWGRCHLGAMSNRFDMRAALRVRGLIRSDGYDLLHAHTPRTAMIASLAATMAGVPWVYHVHSPAVRDSANWWSNHLNHWIEKLSLQTCSHRITVSESLRLECIRKGVDEDAVTVVHNGVPTIRPERTHLPTPNGRWVLGMVALMRPRKGLEIVLDAIAALRAEGHELLLRIIGPFENESYRNEIETRIKTLQIAAAIERVGFTNDVPAELARVDALVLPSLFGEGLPMVVLEAMAAAIPVIATRVEGTPEAVTDGVEGLLAEPRDAKSLADKIRLLITGQCDWSMMAEAAHQRQARCFSDYSMAAATADVYRQIIGR